MPAENDKEIPMAGGKVSSTAIAGYYLIPTEALRRYAERCDAGVERKGKQAWNAVNADPAVTADREFILHRIGHVIIHALKLRDKIVKGDALLGDGIDDDAGAIIWAGGFLCCATKSLQDLMDNKSNERDGSPQVSSEHGSMDVRTRGSVPGSMLRVPTKHERPTKRSAK